MIRIPSIAEIMEVSKSRGASSEAPGLWNGLVGAWTFQERGGLTAFDASGYGNKGTLTAMDPATAWVMTRYGGGLEFDSTANLECVDCGPGDSIASLVFSAVGAIYPSDWGGSTTGRVFDRDAFRLYVNGPQQNLRWKGDPGVGSSVGSIVLDQWHVVAVTRDAAGNVQLYINGVPDGSGVNADTGLGNFIIGNRAAGSRTFGGVIGYLALCHECLPASAIQRLTVDWYRSHRRRRRVYPAAAGEPPEGAIMNQFQNANLGADLFDGSLMAT
jgi:hypothetical protein